MPTNVPVNSVAEKRDALNTSIELRRQETLLKRGALQDAIFNSAYFSCIATDERGVIQIFNVGAERMLGFTAPDVLNRLTPADISDPQELIARATALSLELQLPVSPGFEALVCKASRGIEDIYELTYVRKNGSRLAAVVSVTALRDAKSNIIGYLLIGTDNTVRKQLEAEQSELDQRLRDQQFYTRSLLEANIDALMATDPRGIISDVNQQMVNLTGRTRDELIGAPCKKFFTDPARADAAIKRVLAENRVTDYELTVRAHNGQETMVSYNAATFFNRDRELQGVFAAARDVTERKSLERALKEKNELEHASRMKSEFMASMSHELRTPLNAIIGFSEALRDGLIGPVSQVQAEYIGDIFNGGQHLLSLINDILDLSKIEAGMMAMDFEAVDLRSLLSNSFSMFKEKAATQHITLELDAGADLGMPSLDLRKTKQIVYNLLSNAVKFSGSGGRVILSARRALRAKVGALAGDWPVHSFPLPDSEDAEFLEICVRDSGIGISQANMAKLFQPFTQVDSGLGHKFEGTGLGLAMIKQLVELHGGTVAVASAEDEGACFAAWLPLRAAVQSESTLWASDPSEVGIAKPGERIALVIEDNDKDADLICLLLEAEGFVVLRASNAEDGLLMASQQVLSLITLDIELPGMDGWEFLQQLRDSNTLSQVPVVIVAGQADSHMALARGAAAAMQKPISRTLLKAALAGLGLQPLPMHTHTILVVDDDPKAVEVIATFLPAPAYAVVRAYGGREAITLAQRLRPDLILLDLMMPEVSGFDVVNVLQGNADTVDIPILVVSAKQLTAEERKELKSDPHKTIQIVEKAGFNPVHFIEEVKRALL